MTTSTSPAAPTVAETLSQAIVDLRYEDLPPEVIAKAKACVLDNLGLALGGFDSNAARAVRAVLKDMGATGTVQVLGDDLRLPANLAALANGTQCHSNDFTDTILKTVIHCGPAVVPAALAMTQRQRLDGKSLILLTVIGYEVAGRVAAAINSKPAMMHHKKGFHATSTCGVFGTAALAARALGLSADRMADALGHAGSSSSGLIESITGPTGADTFRSHPGKAAHDGILAALYAQQGMTGPHTVFEGRDAFLHAYSDGDRYTLEPLQRRMGEAFQILDVAVKFHNGTHAIASGVDAMLAITGEHSLDIDRVSEIEVRVPKMHAYIGGDDQEALYRPPNYSKAQMSLPFALATAITRGELFLDQYTEAALADAATLGFARKVRVIADPQMDEMLNAGKWPASVRVTMTDGTRLTGGVDFPKGSPQNPLSAEQHQRKFRRLSEKRIDNARCDAIIALVDDLESLADVETLTSKLVP
ncbi:MmgE/PrpD family protein [Ramlibacter sp.]|uniref:MmgE/PrpD family protein n=1 Tax=Ramlibacter sp. TaxID=1917967 RepID=UPI003D122F49